MSGIQDMWWHDLSSWGFEQPCPMALLFAAHVASLGLALLVARGFPWQMSCISDFPNFLGSPFYLQFHSHSFTYHPLRSFLKEHSHATQCLVSQTFP
jgi:hypothetical protein